MSSFDTLRPSVGSFITSSVTGTEEDPTLPRSTTGTPCWKTIPGEIQIKGDNVFLGYYKNEKATRESFTEDGWFRTGDQGRMDKKGRVYITGRIKNIIVTNTGKNIYPEELEGKLEAIPYIAECMVYGDDSASDEDTKISVMVYPDLEAVKAAAAEAGETLTDAELTETASRYIWGEIKVINKDLPAYKRICGLELRDTEFPKTSTNKIQRFKVMREMKEKQNGQ